MAALWRTASSAVAPALAYHPGTMTQGIISADDHLDLRWLPPNLWTERLPSRFKERAPHIEEAANGPTWFCDGRGWGR